MSQKLCMLITTLKSTYTSIRELFLWKWKEIESHSKSEIDYRFVSNSGSDLKWDILFASKRCETQKQQNTKLILLYLSVKTSQHIVVFWSGSKFIFASVSEPSAIVDFDCNPELKLMATNYSLILFNIEFVTIQMMFRFPCKALNVQPKLYQPVSQPMCLLVQTLNYYPRY